MCGPEERIARLKGLLGQRLDWNRLSRMSLKHRVVPMVCHNLGSKRGAMPFEAFAGLRFHYLSNADRANRCANDLITLVGLFEAAGVSVLVLKGLALSLVAYGDISTRQSLDIDILVRDRDLVRAAEVLGSAGYQGRTYDRIAFESGFFRNTSDEFGTERGACPIDLRWKISDWYFPFGPEENGLWSRSETVSLKGHELPTLDAADHLLFLCAHASKHGWPDLLSIADIGALLRARPLLDLSALIDEAARLHFKRMVLVGLLLAHRLTHAPLPEDVLGTIEADSAVTALGQRIERRLLAQEEAPSGLERWKVTLGTIERRRDRLGVLLKLGLAPTAADYASVHLPRVLYRLYYLVRPFRLAMTALVTAVHRASSLIIQSTDAIDDTEASDALN